MTAIKLTTLACALRRFFAEHLPQVRGASPHTVRSYRDSLALLLRFAAAHAGRSVAQLDLARAQNARVRPHPGHGRSWLRRDRLGWTVSHMVHLLARGGHHSVRLPVPTSHPGYYVRRP